MILKTTDGGVSWTKVYESTSDFGTIWKMQFIDRETAVSSIEYFPGADVDAPKMVKSIDGGNSWYGLGKEVKGYTHQGIGFATPLRGWIGGKYSGLWETIDGGVSWDTLDFGSNFNRFFVMDSAHIYASGQSIYRYGSDFTVGIKTEPQFTEVPHKIYPVSPNPSSGKVKIEFDLGTTTIAVLQVFNLESKKIWEIHRKLLVPGHYTYYWNEPNAPAGNYVVRLNNNDMAISQKFIITN